MSLRGKILLYGGSALVVAAFAPVLPFRHLAAAGVILVGLVLIDVVQSLRRRR
ncbi:MAG: hypothetical protein AB1918_09395 [Pseudomonadota bacterium]